MTTELFKRCPALNHLRGLGSVDIQNVEHSLPVLRAAILELVHYVEKLGEKPAEKPQPVPVTHSLSKVEDFFDHIEIVCRRFGISISHEDEHGSFELNSYSDKDMADLRNADLMFKVDE